jgi:hypothetical protein
LAGNGSISARTNTCRVAQPVESSARDNNVAHSAARAGKGRAQRLLEGIAVLPLQRGEFGPRGFMCGTGGGGALDVAHAVGVGRTLTRHVVCCALCPDLIAAGVARSVDGAQVPTDRQRGEHTDNRQPHGRGD